ncbi:hypothetical protein HY251_15635 [bacterium]|nr:hypothetical protein [bacterium]
MRRALLPLIIIALPLAALAEEPKKAEKAPDPETLGARIREATGRAAKAMAAQERKAKPEYPTDQTEPGYKILVALTLLRAGGADERKVAREMIDVWWENAAKRKLGHSANYELSLAISAIEGLSLERIEDPRPTTVTRYEAKPLDPADKARLEVATRALCVGRLLTDDDRGCAWCYDVAPFTSDTPVSTEDGTPAGRAKPCKPYEDPTLPPPGKGGMPPAKQPGKTNPLLQAPKIPFDLSNSQFAILALHDAARGGVAIPRDVLEQMTYRLVASSQSEKGTCWGYTSFYRSEPYPSMTFAGLSSLAIARELGVTGKQIDALISGALGGIGDRIKKVGKGDWGGRHGWGLSYDLYSLEKALDILEVGEVGGKDWFSPIAEQLLKQQRPDGLWDGDAVDTSFYVLFLTRATVGKARLTDHRTITGKGASTGSLGDVFLPKRKITVDAIECVGAVGSALDVSAARAAAAEAIEALCAEGHGRDACLLGPIAALLPLGGSKHDAATGWLRDLAGKELKPEQARSAAKAATALIEAREKKDASSLRSALGDASLVPPLRAFAASALAALPYPQAAPEIADAAAGLADDKALLATPAGSRCARAYSDALAALVRGSLPSLPAKGVVPPDELRVLARRAKETTKKALEDAVEHALSAYPARERNRDAWVRAREALEAQGEAGFRRLLEIAREPKRAGAAFAVLRGVTGELIPDDIEAWRGFLESKK